MLGIALVGVAIASAAYEPTARHSAAPAPQTAAGPSRATPGIVRTKDTAPGAAHLHAGKPTTLRPHQLFLTRASGAVFDVRKLKGAVVKRERAEHEDPFGPPQAPAGSALPSNVTPSGIAAGAAPAPGPDMSFDGLDFATWGAGHPPDENGDVGPTHYIQTVNTSIGIYDKSTGNRVAAFTFNAFMSQGNFGNLCDTDNFGDPVVLYDSFENRWFITDFAFELDGSGNVVNPPGAFQCFAVSNSGETEELVRLLPSIKRIGAELVAMTGNPASTIAKGADYHLSAAISKEACPLGLAPTASTTATLALGDALAMALLLRKGFKEEDFAFLHPGGKLGKRFLRVRDLMHAGDQVPIVDMKTSMHDVIYEMSKKGFGITAVTHDGRVLDGVITDGDLRRLLQGDEEILKKTPGVSVPVAVGTPG